MSEDSFNNNNESEEKGIDLLELASTLWKQRRKLIVWSICGALVGLVIAFSIPKEYITTVRLAPEITEDKPSGGLGALASMAGFSTASASADAVYPTLYPDVVSSVPFSTSLFDVEVTTKKDGRKMTVSQFLKEETKAPWWSTALSMPFKIIGMLKPEEKEAKEHKLDNFQLTIDENRMVGALNQRIITSVDAKTSVVTINVIMQDPLVSAILADTVISRLQEYITDYRTNKARKDLEYAQKLNREAKANYYKAQQRYADYLDRNQGLAFYSAQTVKERLENEATLAFNLYNQTALGVQKTQAKVQETTPVYAIVTPATVPVKASSPRKMMILIGFTFLAFVACAAWILYIAPLVKSRKSSANKDMQESDSKHSE